MQARTRLTFRWFAGQPEEGLLPKLSAPQAPSIPHQTPPKPTVYRGGFRNKRFFHTSGLQQGKVPRSTRFEARQLFQAQGTIQRSFSRDLEKPGSGWFCRASEPKRPDLAEKCPGLFQASPFPDRLIQVIQISPPGAPGYALRAARTAKHSSRWGSCGRVGKFTGSLGLWGRASVPEALGSGAWPAPPPDWGAGEAGYSRGRGGSFQPIAAGGRGARRL